MILLTDLSEVLIKGVCGAELIIQERYGRKVAKRYLKRRAETNQIFCELMRGHLSEDVYWYVFMQDDDWPFSVDELKTIFSYNFVQKIPGTLELYKRIIGYPERIGAKDAPIEGRPEIWLVSDHIFERKVELEYLHPELFEMTSKQIWSFDYSLLKSDPGFFKQVLDGYNLLPEEVVFIDDLSVNLASAAAEGITTIKFENANQLEIELGALGFLFAETSNDSSSLNHYFQS